VRNAEDKVSTTIVRRCLAGREGVFADDAQEAGSLSAAASVADLKLRSVLCIPLTAGERCLGCIYLDHRFHKGVFAAEDLPWLQALADQAAIALHLHGLLERQTLRERAVDADNRALAEQLLDQERRELVAEADLRRERLDHSYPELVGESPALVRHLRLLDRVTAGDFPVLLCGESGAGKELAARAIWAHGRRAAGPFVAVNVAAISPSLLESELFGHVRGAFTGADRDRAGLFAEARGGVLFLDEVTEMPVEMQAKLLRVLEDGRVRPVGGDREVPVDLRVLSATNREPARAIADGRLREDLFYRLAVVTVAVPPLRERLVDVPQLVEHFLAQAAALRGGPRKRAVPALVAALQRRSWPGNLRELRNTVLRLDALATGEEVGPELLADVATHGIARPRTLDLRELERWAIDEALRAANGNKAEAARLCGISRRALYNKLERRAEG
jgi:DNA-binding NtrC family response regulator